MMVIGSGPLEDQVRHACEKYSNLHYIGYIPRSTCLQYLAGSDLLVLPSRIEGTPTVLLEAMALKVPIVASKIPGILNVVDDTSAILIDSTQPVELANTINKYVSNYPKELVIKAYEKVSSEFNWDTVISSYVELYTLLLGKL